MTFFDLLAFGLTAVGALLAVTPAGKSIAWAIVRREIRNEKSKELLEEAKRNDEVIAIQRRSEVESVRHEQTMIAETTRLEVMKATRDAVVKQATDAVAAGEIPQIALPAVLKDPIVPPPVDKAAGDTTSNTIQRLENLTAMQRSLLDQMHASNFSYQNLMGGARRSVGPFQHPERRVYRNIGGGVEFHDHLER